MDVDEASKALAEIQRRNEQTLRRGSPRRFPVWYTYGSAAALALVWASGDVSGWAAIGLMAAGVFMTIGLTVLLERITGVRLRMRALRVAPMAIITGLMLVTAIVVGSVMRLLDVPVANTIGGLAAGVVAIIGMGRAQAAAANVRDSE